MIVDGAGVEPASWIIGAPHHSFSPRNITARLPGLSPGCF